MGDSPLASGEALTQVSALAPKASSSASEDHLHTMAKAFAWSGTGMWSTQLFTWLATFTVARLLAPSDYGLIGIAQIFVGLVMEVNDYGLGLTVVNLQDLTEEQIGQLNTLSVLFGATAFCLSCLIARPLGMFFRMPHLPLLVIALSTTFLISAIKTIPSALLQRNLQFRTLAGIEAASYSAYAASTLITAFLGFGYWSLVIGLVSLSLCSATMTLRQRRHGLAWPDVHSLRYPLKFTGHILASGVSWYVYANSDLLAAGRVLGQSAVGAYTFAVTLASAPADKITGLIQRVVPSFFAAAHEEKPILRSYLLTLSEIVFVFLLPATLGLAIVADQFIAVALGRKWLAAVTPLRILLVYATAKALTNTLSPMLNAKRQSHYTMWTNVAAAIYFPIGFFIGARWGTAGIAATWVALYPFLAVPLFWRTFKEIELRWTEYARALWPAFSSSVVMALAVTFLRMSLPVAWPNSARLVLEIAAGMVVYGLCMSALHGRELRRLYRIVRPGEPVCA
jgi:O-antigen/teichoic acid export membrane protein